MELLESGGSLALLSKAERLYAKAALRNVAIPNISVDSDEPILDRIKKHPLLRAVLETDGSTYASRMPDFSQAIDHLARNYKTGRGSMSSRVGRSLAEAALTIKDGDVVARVVQGRGHCLDWALTLALVHEVYYPQEGKVIIVPFGRRPRQEELHLRPHFGLVWLKGEESSVILYGGERIPFAYLDTKEARRKLVEEKGIDRKIVAEALRIYRSWKKQANLAGVAA